MGKFQCMSHKCSACCALVGWQITASQSDSAGVCEHGLVPLLQFITSECTAAKDTRSIILTLPMSRNINCSLLICLWNAETLSENRGSYKVWLAVCVRSNVCNPVHNSDRPLRKCRHFVVPNNSDAQIKKCRSEEKSPLLHSVVNKHVPKSMGPLHWR